MRLAIALAMLATPVAGQDWRQSEVTIQHHAPQAQPFATIHLRNADGSSIGAPPVTIQTAHGPVTYGHAVSMNGPSGCCPDRLTVLSWPDGVAPVPHSIEIEEGHAGRIDLYLHVGF
jgi:hypothetical protein